MRCHLKLLLWFKKKLPDHFKPVLYLPREHCQHYGMSWKIINSYQCRFGTGSVCNLLKKEEYLRGVNRQINQLQVEQSILHVEYKKICTFLLVGSIL